MQLAVVLLLGWALIGHMALSVAFVNRVHATGIPVRLGKLVWLSAALLITLVPAFFGYWFHVRGLRLGPGTGLAWLPAPAVPYLAACWAAATLARSTGSGGTSCTGPRRRSDRIAGGSSACCKTARGSPARSTSTISSFTFRATKYSASTWPNGGSNWSACPRPSIDSRSST